MFLDSLSPFPGLELHLTGGMTGDDEKFVHEIKKKLRSEGVLDDVVFLPEFDRKNRIQFFKKLNVLTVPIPQGEAFGTFQIEALAAGVPIVQPNMGAFPEFIQDAGGGVLYEPNDAKHLAEAIGKLLSNPEQMKQLAHQGREAVLKDYCLDCMAKNMANVYKRILSSF
ncbi:glycosyltransferase family 4 protein [bacterium]